MATGMDFMLKSLGLDPEEIKKNIAGMGTMLVEFKAQLDRIEADQKLILQRINDHAKPGSERTDPPSGTDAPRIGRAADTGAGFADNGKTERGPANVSG